MVIRIVTFRILSDKNETATQVCKSEILPSLISIKGLLSVELLRAPARNGQDEWLSLTRWASREDLNRYVPSGMAQQYLAKLTDLLSEAPGPVRTYEPVG